MTKQESKRVKAVSEMMADIMCDATWLTVNLESLYKWLDLGMHWDPNTLTTRELCEQLIEASVEPCNCQS